MVNFQLSRRVDEWLTQSQNLLSLAPAEAFLAGPDADYRGIIATCLTPLDAEGRVAFAALERQIDYIVDDCRADAIAIAATEDAEYTMLDWAQRKELIVRGTALVRGRIPVVVGISHPAPQHVIELAEHPKALSAVQC